MADKVSSKPLEEFTLTDFTARPDFSQASDFTRHYSVERRGIMGDAPSTTKLVNIQVDREKDYVTFYFLTEATEKYGPDYTYKDVDPSKHFQLEKDPSKLYEIQLRFYHYGEYLKHDPLTQILTKQWLWDTDFAIWSNAPSFHWQGFNYNLSKLGAAIHPTNIAPQVWNHFHGDALIDKHLFDLFIHIKFFINQMASSVLNASRKGPRKHKKIISNPNPPAGIPPVGPRASEPLVVPEAPEAQTTVQPEVLEKPTMKTPEPTDMTFDGEDPEDSLLPEPTMESMKRKLGATMDKAMDVLYEVEPQHRYDEIWVDFDSSTAKIYQSSVFEHKHAPAQEITGWTREQLRSMSVEDMIKLAYRAISAGPQRQKDYYPAFREACRIIKNAFLNSDIYPGIKKPSTFNSSDPSSVCVRIAVYGVAEHNGIKARPAGGLLYVNKRRFKDVLKEQLDLKRTAPIEWTKDSMGDIFSFDINGSKYTAMFENDSDIAAVTIMDYDQKSDEFYYNFPVQLDWKTRKKFYGVFSQCHEVNFSFEDSKSPGSSSMGLTGKGNVGLIFNTLVKGMIDYFNGADRQNIDIITFECGLDSPSRPKIYKRLADYVIQMFDYNYILVIGTSTSGSHNTFMLISDSVYADTFGTLNNIKESLEEDADSKDSMRSHSSGGSGSSGSLGDSEDSIVVCTMGSFNPPTIQHQRLLQKVVASAGSLHADNVVYILQDSGFSQDKLSLQQKGHVLKALVPQINIEMANTVSTPYEALVDLYNRDYTEVYILVGSDQVSEYQELVDTNNDVKTKFGYFKFSTCKVVSYGYPNPDKSMEATKARNAAISNDFEAFTKGIQIPYFSGAKQLFNILRYELSKSVGV